MKPKRDMLGTLVMLVASAVLATAAPVSARGTVASIGADPSGPSIAVASADGVSRTYEIARGARVREHATGDPWQPASLASLEVGEPVTLTLDASGKASAIDAEYGRVFVRAVVVSGGYLIGTDGVAHRLVAAAAAMAPIPLGAYVALRVYPAGGSAFDAEVSSHPFAGAAAAMVDVTFAVRVPANTPPSATIYLATNAQSWTANAVRLAPAPGNVWTGVLKLAPGTMLKYKYTRGSWASGESDAAGSQTPSRTLTVAGGATAQRVDDVVVRWVDLPS